MKREWFRLDNAALIFPAILRRNWNNAFRLSATLTEKVDPEILSKAAADLLPRFPSFFVRLRTGFFWSYLEVLKKAPPVHEDYAYPLTLMKRKELRRSCIRILYFENRIAVEFFHSVTDGTGGSIFLENLVARYLEIRDGIAIPKTEGVLDLTEEPKETELQDGFLKCEASQSLSRKEEETFHLFGTPEPDFFRNLITGILNTDELLDLAHQYGVTVNIFLSAVMAESIVRLQKEVRRKKHEKPVKVTIPVNFRRLFGIDTLRNFILTVNVGIDPGLGEYSLPEICEYMKHSFAVESDPKRMAAKVAANVKPAKNLFIRLFPLPFKNIAMRQVYRYTGEKRGCINVSNLGVFQTPREMEERVRRVEFIIGVQYSYPNNCSVISYQGKTYINMIRSIQETELERLFFSRLRELGLSVEIESLSRR